MSTRKVTVELELEVSRYNRGAAEALATTRGLKAGLEGLGDEADDTSRDMDQLAANTDIAKTLIDDFGDEARGAAVGVTLLDQRITALRHSVQRLGLAFATSMDPDVGRQFESERSALARLERLRKAITPGATKLFDPKNFGGFDFSGFAAESRGFLIAGLIGTVVAMAPMLAGIISSALVGAIGMGGVVGGAFLAARDFRVQQAWKELGSSLMDELDAAGVVFIEPITRAAAAFKQAFDAADIVGTLRAAAPLVEPMTEMLAGFVRELGPGLRAAVMGAGPTMQMLARELPDLGGSLTDMFRSMSGVAPEAAMAFGDFFDVLEVGVTTTGDALAGLTEVYAMTRSLNATIKDLTGGVDLLNIALETSPLIVLGKMARQHVVPTLEAIDFEAREVAAAILDIDTSLVAATPGLDYFAQQMEHVRDTLHGWIDAEVDVEEALDNLHDSFEKNGRSLDVHDAKGRANIRMLEAYERAVMNAYDAELQNTNSIEAAQAVWQHYRDSLYELFKTFGITGKAADELVNKFLGIPPLTIPVNVVYTTIIQGPRPPTNAYINDIYSNPFLKGFAQGGVTPAFEPFRVHEGEVMFSSREHFMATKSEVDALERGGGAGGSDVNVTVLLDGQAIEPRMVRVLSETNRDTRRRVMAGATR